MSKKVKEQVRYNPAFSSVKRTKKAFKAFTGKTNQMLCVFYLVLIFIILIVSSCWAVFDSADFLKENVDGMFGYIIMFMSLTLFALNLCIPNDIKTQETARGNVHGCAAVSEVMMHLPIAKLDVYRLSFRAYLAFMAFPAIHITVINIMHIIDERFETIAASTGLMNLLYAVISLCAYLTTFNVFRRVSNRFKSGILISLLLIFYVVLLLSTFDICKEFIELPVFGFFAGIVGLIMLVCVFAAVIIIQKTVVEKRAASTAWYQR